MGRVTKPAQNEPKITSHVLCALTMRLVASSSAVSYCNTSRSMKFQGMPKRELWAVLPSQTFSLTAMSWL
jgi:hypothetical protein